MATRCWFALFPLLLGLATPLHASPSLLDTLSQQTSSTNANDFLPVNEAFPFSYQVTADQLLLSWDIAPDYYLYQGQFRLEVNGQAVDLALPPGKDYHDPYFGDVVIYRQPLDVAVPLSALGEATQATVTYQGCADAGLCYPPESQQLLFAATASAPSGPASSSASNASSATSAPSATQSEHEGFASRLESQALWLNIALFFAIGLGLAFTPCVFPMYPIITGLIAGQQRPLSTRKAASLSLTYVLGMAITYTALGLVVASAGLQFQAALQHPYVLSAIALLFVLLSLSMFGLYQLQLPASLQNRLNQLSNQQQGGQYWGVALMGAISGLVASPCTAAPISGVLLFVAQSGDLALGGMALFALSLGMGVPLLIVGTSSGRLLPKAGAWMEQVKIVFGILLLAVAVVMLERFVLPSVGRLLWLALIAGSISYYYHLNRLSTLSFAQSLRQLGLVTALGLSIAWASQPWWQQAPAQQHGEFIQVSDLKQLEQQLAIAKQQNRPVMVDFYADWCVACKEFEQYTFSDPAVAAKLDTMVLLQADVTRTDAAAIELLNHYQVLGLPTLLLFADNGQELSQARVTGFMNAEAFNAHLTLNGL